MKIKGREIKGKNRKTLVLPREGDDDLVFIAEAISNIGEINDLLPIPSPPVVQKAGGAIEKNFKDEGYIMQMIDYNARRMAWVILESLKPSEITWDTVDMDSPKTWTNIYKEMADAGINQIEAKLIEDAVLEANALDDEKIEAARQLFLLGQAAAAKSTSGPNTTQSSTPSGEPASGGE